MNIIPKTRTKFGEQIGVEVFIQAPNIADTKQTYLTTNANAAVSSLSVESGTKFALDDYMVVGNIGAEKTEIVRVHASTPPTISAITLAAVTTLDHSRGDKVQFIPYNQIVIQKSIDGGATYADLTTLSIRVDASETYYNDTTGLSTYYYRAKFKNSATALVSENSSGVLATGYAENSAGAVIRDALVSLGEKIDDEVLTREFLLRVLDEGRDEIDLHENVDRWSFRTAFDYKAGSIIPGTYTLDLPTNLRDGNTFKNVLGVRIGKNGLRLHQVDKISMSENYQGVAHTTVGSVMADSDITIILTASGDFDEGGSISIAGASVNTVVDVVAYTSNNEATGVISGVTGIATGGHAAGRDVWQGAAFGLPFEYTVFEGKMVFSQPFADDLAGQNIWLDYYKKKTLMTTEGDLFDEPFYRIYLPYMRYRIKARKNPQMIREEDDDYKAWVEKREAQVKKEFTGQDLRISVDVPDNRQIII